MIESKWLEVMRTYQRYRCQFGGVPVVTFGAIKHHIKTSRDSQVSLVTKNPPADAGNVRDSGSVSGWGRSRAWQPTPVFLPGESSWTEEPRGLQFIGLQRMDTSEAT